MSLRVAINGFGRTGRAAFRAAYESGAEIEWVAINDVADKDQVDAEWDALLARCDDAPA